MARLEEYMKVNRRIEDVFRYVSDFSHIDQWDPGVTAAEKLTPGPVGPGTRYRLRLKYGLMSSTMSYEIREYDPPRRVVLDGRGGAYKARDTITFEPLGDKTGIVYRVELAFGGFLGRIEPLLRGKLAGIGRAAADGLERAFNEPVPVSRISEVDRLADRSVLFGLWAFTRLGFMRSRKHWRPMPVFLDGKTAVVTGATSGIGYAAALGLAGLGARVVIVARDAAKARETKAALIHQTGNNNIAISLADMAEMEQVRSLAARLREAETAVDILVNNAGALFKRRRFTAEGLEATFALDLMAPFVLTNELMPKLSASAPARIINVSSGGMYTQKIRVDDLQFARTPYDGAKAYARAKRGLVVLTELWADRLKGKGITVHAMHPGWVDTPGIRRSLPAFHRLTEKWLRTPAQGADTIVWLAAAPEAAKVNGLFWLDRRPRLTHVFPGTREATQERGQFWEALNHHARIVGR